MNCLNCFKNWKKEGVGIELNLTLSVKYFERKYLSTAEKLVIIVTIKEFFSALNQEMGYIPSYERIIKSMNPPPPPAPFIKTLKTIYTLQVLPSGHATPRQRRINTDASTLMRALYRLHVPAGWRLTSSRKVNGWQEI